ncbi:MAG: hypothetical protein P1V36_09125 [Planctomycetota bacterium]|nr:hypothetical protein [Planctomycetota bacterium]
MPRAAGVLALALLGCLLLGGTFGRAEAEDSPAAKPKAGSTSVAPEAWSRVPLPAAAQRGIKWLVLNQNADGGWGQEGAAATRAGKGRKRGQPAAPHSGSTKSDVGNTSLAALAIIATGSRPNTGTFQGPLVRAVSYILSEYDRAPKSGLAVTMREGTQLQGKIGRHADTFLATRVLLEVDGRMPAKAANARVHKALEDMLARIQKHQDKDGSWNGAQGWAPIHSTAYASQALHIAKARGFAIDEQVLAKVERFTVRQLKEQARTARGKPTPPKRTRRGGRPPVITPSGGSGGADLGPISVGGAGIVLYSLSQGFEQLSRTAATRTRFRKELKQIESKVSEPRVMKGFGSMGGEEFISYVNIAVGMARLGSQDSTRWLAGLQGRMAKLQNRDGSWSGHHCITGRTAVTGLAVLTLTAERQVPRRAR